MLQLVICHCQCGSVSKLAFAPAPAEKSLIFVAVHNLYLIGWITSCKALTMTFTVLYKINIPKNKIISSIGKKHTF